jgi:hypothetical protein
MYPFAPQCLQVLLAQGGYPESRAEDYELWLRLLFPTPSSMRATVITNTGVVCSALGRAGATTSLCPLIQSLAHACRTFTSECLRISTPQGQVPLNIGHPLPERPRLPLRRHVVTRMRCLPALLQ